MNGVMSDLAAGKITFGFGQSNQMYNECPDGVLQWKEWYNLAWTVYDATLHCVDGI